MRVFSILIVVTNCLFASMSHSSEANQSKIIHLPAVSNLPIHVLMSKNASANLIGFVGGKGLKSKKGISKNFIVKQRDFFAHSGLNFYLFPNFNQNEDASYQLRSSRKRLQRIHALVESIKKYDDKPIYLLGFSRGSVDVGAFAKKHPELIEGIILMSGIYKNKSYKARNSSMDKIIGTTMSVATLVVHHERDACKVTKFAAAKNFYRDLKSPNKMMLTFTAGHGTGNACGPKHFHGFEKIEANVARSVARWIAENISSQ